MYGCYSSVLFGEALGGICRVIYYIDMIPVIFNCTLKMDYYWSARVTSNRLKIMTTKY